MCAICGMIAMEAGPDVISRLLRTMAHRGPDSQGVCQIGDTVLLHSRLAVIDLEKGRQPMTLTWNGETYTLIYNGELYNTEQLRTELQKAGHQFQGHSDTEVVLHAYAQYGAACLDKMNGIFAFAVWEQGRRRLFLARDRIGVKPLFYRWEAGKLIFASEIKTILAHPAVRPELEEQGAAQLIMLGPGRLPGSGIFRGISELEPGWMAYIQEGKIQLHQYWKLTDREHGETFAQTRDHVRYLVEDAIRRQMVSDVPIGTFLSGGLDSSIITAICAGEAAKRGERLQTFSVGYENNDRYFQASKFQPNSDDAYIRLMAEALNTQHHTTVLRPEDLVEALEPATFARDLPGMADVDFSLIAFCKDIRQHVTVALSGECADEIFGGYPWYRDPEVRESAGFPWAQNTAQREGILSSQIKISGSDMVMDAYLQTCRESDVLPGTAPQERRMKEMVNLNFRWFMQTLLDRKDRMSMAHSLEVRVPFCDHRIAEYLYGVPWEYKDYQGQEKGLLRQAMTGLLPEEVLFRKKSPYPKTFDPRYERLVRQRLEDLLKSDSPLWYLTNKENVRRILTEESPWPWYGQLMRRPQTMAWFLQLDVWLRHYQIEFCF